MDHTGHETEAQTLRAVASAAAAEGMPSPMDGRGIVVCAGGPVMITNAVVLVRMLREVLGSTLPVEIWHLGAREMPRFLARMLEGFGCTVVDAHAILETHAGAIHDGWQLKAYALKHCRFAEVLLLDADQVPVRDPAEAFDWPQFREHGAVLWPDAVDLSEDNPVWALTGLEPRRTVSEESAQLLVDKRRHWATVCLALHMNERADVFYTLVYGDKDVFLLACLVTGAPFTMVPHAPVEDAAYFAQRDFDGAVLFQHRSNAKWSLDGTPARPPGFLFQDECEGFLEELRAVWDGRIFNAPPRPAAAHAVEADLAGQRHFTLSRGGEAPERFELLDGHQIGAGRSYRAATWHVEADGGDLVLVVRDAAKPVLRLTRVEDGYWSGHSTVQPHVAAVLAPDARDAGAPHGRATAGLVGELVDAARVGGRLDAAGAARLADALALLARVSPTVARDLERHMATLAPGDDTRAVLETVLAGLRAAVPADRGKVTRSPVKMLSDERFYKRP